MGHFAVSSIAAFIAVNVIVIVSGLIVQVRLKNHPSAVESPSQPQDKKVGADD